MQENTIDPKVQEFIEELDKKALDKEFPNRKDRRRTLGFAARLDREKARKGAQISADKRKAVIQVIDKIVGLTWKYIEKDDIAAYTEAKVLKEELDMTEKMQLTQYDGRQVKAAVERMRSVLDRAAAKMRGQV